MKSRNAILLAVAAVMAALLIPIAAAGGKKPPPAPPEFWGMAPQSGMTDRDAEYMVAGKIGIVRLPVPWSSVQPTRKSPYNWAGLDEGVEVAARAGIRVLPFIYGTPTWLSKPTRLPVDNGRVRSAWRKFLTAMVERYGPGGEFWAEHAAGGVGVTYEPALPRPLPIRHWQIWNEANFFYFTTPASPSRYAKLLTLSSRTIKAFDPGAKVILAGLFADPAPGYPKGKPAAEFLEKLYRVRGIKRHFDGIALHPYAVDAETLEEFVEEFYEVAVENRDRPGLYITEMGWGSEDNFEEVAFEQGPRGQLRQLRDSYGYLLENRARLNVKQVYWFSWKDVDSETCSFCDSVGLFREGKGFKPKPAWRAFVALSGGTIRP
jgi:hypothetical protein